MKNSEIREIDKSQILEHIRFENPWWEKPSEIKENFKLLKPRPYFDAFFRLVTTKDPPRALILLGLRRVGKTVMMHHAIQKLIDTGVDPKSIFYFSMDHPIYQQIELSKKGLEDLFSMAREASGTKKKKEFYVFYDEIQYFKDWERHLKYIVDWYTGNKFIASGSAAAALKLKSMESGAGRFTEFKLPPLSFYEYLNLIDKSDLVQFEKFGPHSEYICSDIKELNEHFTNYLNFGGFPEVISYLNISENPQRYITSDIIDKVLMRDLPGLYGIQDTQELNSFFTMLAFNTANEVSLDSLSQQSNVAKNTIRRYLEYLEAAFLIVIVRRIDRDARTFTRDNFFKVYLTNPSLYCALFSFVDPDSSNFGHVVESAVFNNYSSYASNSFESTNYARWKKGEIDIVSMKKRKPVEVIESKWSDRCVKNPGELKNLFEFCHKHNVPTAYVTTKSISADRTIENVHLKFIPASLFCYQYGSLFAAFEGFISHLLNLSKEE